MAYIDRGKAFDVLTEYYHHKTLIQKESLKEALSRVPTADVVEAVCCGDCKHWMDIDNGRQKHEMCAQLMPEWFCADGERKETEDGETKVK